MSRISMLLTAMVTASALTACGSAVQQSAEKAAPVAAEQEAIEAISETEGITEALEQNTETKEEKIMKLMIDNTEVSIQWEDNASVESLREMTSSAPLSISMSMYGGNEQVGPIGKSLTRDDRQTTTHSGDLVLYSGNQIVIFYGSNSWAYTRLGHITDPTGNDLAQLLSNGDVTLTFVTE